MSSGTVSSDQQQKKPDGHTCPRIVHHCSPLNPLLKLFLNNNNIGSDSVGRSTARASRDCKLYCQFIFGASQTKLDQYQKRGPFKKNLCVLVTYSRNWVPDPVPKFITWFQIQVTETQFALITDETKAMKPIYSWMMISNCLNELFVPRPGYDCYYFYTKKNARLWKIFRD